MHPKTVKHQITIRGFKYNGNVLKSLVETDDFRNSSRLHHHLNPLNQPSTSTTLYYRPTRSVVDL